MSDSKVEFYREQANELRASVEEGMDDDTRASLTRLADYFEQMARDIERRIAAKLTLNTSFG